MSKRNPFSTPRLENDFTLNGYMPPQKTTFDTPTHLAHTEEPWSSLHSKGTLSSNRRSVSRHQKTTAAQQGETSLENQDISEQSPADSARQGPADSLDLHLSSVYDHHVDLLSNKNQTVLQRRTQSAERRPTQQRREQQLQQEREQERDITMWIDPQRRSIHSINKH